MTDSPSVRIRQIVVQSGIWCAIIIATLLILEGGASAFLFFSDVVGAGSPAHPTRPHTVHDSLLGWRNTPGFSSPNEYGKGIGLSIDDAGFRKTSEAVAPPSAPKGTLICSGDSYAFGVGVADDRTWCSLLAAGVPGLHAANMAQDSYGLDQSYLFLERDGPRAPNQVQLLGLTSAALERSLADNDAGWFKPHFALHGGALRVQNVPVPFQTGAALQHEALGRTVSDIRIVQALRRMFSIDLDARKAERVDANRPLFEAMIDSLAALDRARGTDLVVVYLPTMQDAKPGRLDARRQWLADYARKRGIPFVDLTLALRALRSDSLAVAFISNSSPVVTPKAAGQYSDVGHAWVARALAPHLGRLARATSR